MSVWVHVYSHTCGIWKQMSGLSHHYSPSCLLRQGLSLIPALTDCLDWLATELQDSLCCFPQHGGYRCAPACLTFTQGLRIRTPVLKPVGQALHWLRHLPCPSLIVFCDSDQHIFFLTVGVAFVEQFANPFLGLHKILILLLLWVPLLSRTQNILFTSRSIFWRGCYILCLDQLFPRLQHE